MTKLVPDQEHLLVKNKIEHTEPSLVDLSDETDYLGQKPNRKLFGFYRFHLKTYQLGQRGYDKGKDSGSLRTALVNIGEPPVIIDTFKCGLAAKKLSDYYFSKGFLNNTVTYEVVPGKLAKKKATVIYHVDLGEFQKISSVNYVGSSEEIDKIIDSLQFQSPLVQGQRLDFERIQGDRNRLTHDLKNNGYYYFNSSYINYSLDTNRVNGMVDIVVNVRGQEDLAHKQQHINDVIVLVGSGKNTDTLQTDGLKFVHNSYKINTELLIDRIVMRPGHLYSINAVSRTYSELLNTGLFRFVTIRFIPHGEDTSGLLDVEITLQTTSKHDLTWEPQAIYTEQGAGIRGTSQTLGIGNNITLVNRNVFGNGEALNFTANTALETQLKKDSVKAFSNLRQNVSAQIVLPSILFFEETNFTADMKSKSTMFTMSYLYESNLNYIRHVLPFNFSYAFEKNKTVYSFTPMRFSFNRAVVEQAFLDDLDDASKEYINQLLTNNIITGPVLSVFWTNQSINPKQYFTVRSNAFELSGSALGTYYKLFTNQTQLNKTFLGVRYSQYIRSDFDVSFNQILDQNNAFVYRVFAGVGLPFGNSAFLPFERRFFVGGANSLRAWRPRAIGPGAFVDENSTISIEKTGEVMIQANWEYRFGIIDQMLEGAVFLDAGNTWNMTQDEKFPDGHFQIDKFYKQLAFNTGLGARFDLDFLIFRIDWGIALHDPSKPTAQKWVIKNNLNKDWVTDNSALNFAVGYPF